MFPTDLSSPLTDYHTLRDEEGKPKLDEAGNVQYDFSGYPLGRFGSDPDIAGPVLYLASKAGGYVSGSTLLSDGGWLNLHPSSY